MSFLAALALVVVAFTVAVLNARAVRAGPTLDARRAADRIDALLPQTQCERCGYPGCRPYAEAIAARRAPINRCPPGGEALIGKLSELIGEPVLPLDPDCGPVEPPSIAVIDETICIGCTKCIPPCPTDAIVGASGQIHAVIAARCTGCGLCLPPCPVDCITLDPVGGRR